MYMPFGPTTSVFRRHLGFSSNVMTCILVRTTILITLAQAFRGPRIPCSGHDSEGALRTILSDAYETKLGDYRSEVEDLQQALFHFNEELVHMVSHYSGSTVQEPPRREQFELPFFLAQEAIHEYFQSNILVLDAALHTASPHVPRLHTDDSLEMADASDIRLETCDAMEGITSPMH